MNDLAESVRPQAEQLDDDKTLELIDKAKEQMEEEKTLRAINTMRKLKNRAEDKGYTFEE